MQFSLCWIFDTSAECSRVSTGKLVETEALDRLCLFQLGILLHQLLQSKPCKLYRNLRILPIPFALVYRAFPIFRMADALSGSETPLPGRLFHPGLRQAELLAPRCKKLGNVIDGVIRLCRHWLRLGRPRPRAPRRTLILILVRVMGSPFLVWRGHSCPRLPAPGGCPRRICPPPS